MTDELNLSDKNLSGADLRDSNLEGATLPDNFKSHDQAKQIAHLKSLNIEGLQI